MNRINIDYNSVEDFISKLSKELNIGYKKVQGEYSILIPNDIGEGYINAIQFPQGLTLFNFSFRFAKTTHFAIRHLLINPVLILQCVEGSLKSWIKSKEDFQHLDSHQYTFIAPNATDTNNIVFEGGMPYKVTYMEVDRTKYMKSLPFKITETNPFYYDLFQNTNLLNHRLLPSGFNLKISENIKEIWNCELEGLPRVNFLGSKVLQMLSEVLTAYKQDINHKIRKGLSEKEYQSVSIIADEIHHNMTQRKTNQEYAEMVGISVTSLQKSFKKVYGKTLNEHIRDVRLSKAMDLLQTREKNINEIVHAVGLKSHSYFSKEFKLKYGISPREFISD